ncbi:MAG: phenylalanine--tRNA ligase subunit alpha, partial [Kaistella sp.]
MLEKIDELLVEVGHFSSADKDEIEQFRIRFSGKKGILNDIFSKFKDVPNEQKKEFGQKINTLKQAVETKLEDLKNTTSSNLILEKEDLTRPGFSSELGTRHPINLVKNKIIEIFKSIGFAVADGPEIEDDWHNFTALNLPEYHPARDMQDTFFVGTDFLLRTHTSPVQIRVMEKFKPPVRTIMPGRCYRNEAVSSRSFCMFHQVEGLYVDEGVTFAELKGTLVSFAKQFYGENILYRFRPSFFPFTEPSAEMDITCFMCEGKGCKICKQSGWLEILGCGMVDPNVFEAVGYDPEIYTG